MSAMVSQITGVSIVCWTVGSGADHRKHQELPVAGLCAGNSPVTGEFPAQKASNAEMFLFDDVIMMIRYQPIREIISYKVNKFRLVEHVIGPALITHPGAPFTSMV